MYKILKGLLQSAVFLIASLVTMPAFAEACGVVTTERDPLNIRESSSQTATVIAKAASGSALSILSTHGTWYKVRLNDDKVGYGSVDYIRKSTSQEGCGIVTTKRDPLNIRKSSSQTATVIAKAANGSALRILSTHGTWYKVKLNNGDVGYGSVDYIKDGVNYTAKPTSYPESCGIVITKQDPLNIRKSPSQTAKVIGKAATDSALRILSTHDSHDYTWGKVKLNNGDVGYGRMDYIMELTPKKAVLCVIVTTKRGPLNIRSGPSQEKEVIGKAAKGSALNIVDSSDGWDKVILNNGKVGYASSDYVR